MRKVMIALLAVAAMGGLAACTKCAPKGAGEKAALTVDAIGGALAPAICEKYGSCNQGQDFNKDQCQKDISTGITENLKQAKDLKIDQAKLDGCLKAVKESPCEALNSQTPPQGCEFLQ